MSLELFLVSTCSDDVQPSEPRPPATDKKKRKTRRRTTDNRPLLTIKSVQPENEDLTVSCDLDAGKALVTFDFDCNHDTADIIIKNLVSTQLSFWCLLPGMLSAICRKYSSI